MARLVSPHTQSLLIAALANRGKWTGQRRGVRIRLELDPQTDISGMRINWTAYAIGTDWRTAHKGRAGTVFEALQQIEATLRNRKDDLKRERAK